MRAAQVLLFPIPIEDSAADQASRRVNSRCTLCGDSGWRYVAGGVTRCDCRRQKPTSREVTVRIRVDHKAAAAGER